MVFLVSNGQLEGQDSNSFKVFLSHAKTNVKINVYAVAQKMTVGRPNEIPISLSLTTVQFLVRMTSCLVCQTYHLMRTSCAMIQLKLVYLRDDVNNPHYIMNPQKKAADGRITVISPPLLPPTHHRKQQHRLIRVHLLAPVLLSCWKIRGGWCALEPRPRNCAQVSDFHQRQWRSQSVET